MNKLQNIFIQASATVLIAALTSGCSAEAKKSRLARRAEEFFKAGDYDKAKIEYTNLLRLDPKNPVPFEKIGIMWLEEGAPLRAGPFLVRAKELAPTRAEIRTKLAEVYTAVGGLDLSREEALEALNIEPGNDNAILLMADAARTLEEIAEAEQQLKNSKRTDSVNYNLAAGTIALRKNDVAALEPALRRAIAADPKSPTAHLALARYFLAMKNNDAAAVEFKTSADLAPPRNSAHLLYAEFKAQTGARDEAVAYLNDLVKKAPDFLPAWTLLAKYASQKNFDEGLKILDNVFRRDTQNFDARMLESEFYISKGDSKKAIEALKQLESTYAKIPLVKYQLARAYLQSGDGGTAITYLDQALVLAPDYGDAILLQAETNLRNGTSAPVVPVLEDFLKKNPTSDRAQVLLADAYRATQRYDDAAAILRKQIAAGPNNPQPYLLLGVLLRQQNKIPEARQMLEKAAELSTDKLAAVNQLLEIDMQANDYPAALQRVNAQLEKTPDSPGLYLLQGKIYAAQSNWDLAEAALLKVIQLNADIPSAYELLVSVYVAAQKLPQAVSQLEAFLVKAPSNAGALMTLALIYNETKNYEKARDTYERLLAIKPDITLAMNNLAYIYSDNLNQLDKGKEWASKAHNAEPGNPSIGDTLGWILYRQGDYKQAFALLKDSAEKLPNQAEVRYHAGMASYMMGDSKSARALLESAANSPMDFPGKDEARRRLASLADGSAKGSEVSVEELETLLKQQPHDPVALANVAEAYEKQGAVEKAANAYEKAIKINPTLVAATIKLAQLYAGPLKKKERALELAKKARELAPGDARSAGILGHLAFQAGNFTWAYSLLQESARQLNDDPEVLKNFAWAAYSIGKIPEARQTMERVAKAARGSETDGAKIFLTLTAPEANNGIGADLLAEAQRVLKDDPTFVPAKMVQARVQAGTGEKEAAIRNYNAILSGFPDFAPAQKDLAAVYLDDPKQQMKAYELATNARKTLPSDPELAAILGSASYYKKDYGRAAQLLQEGNRQKPLSSKQLYFLGMSQLRIRQVAEGRETLERALKSGLEEPLAAEAQQVLSQEPPK